MEKTLQTIQSKLVTIEDELKKVVRRQDTLQKSVDVQVADRNILEDILTRLSAVEEALHLNKDHQAEMQKDTKADILDVKYAVEDKIENKINEVRVGIEEKTIIVRSTKESIFAKIKKMLKGGEMKK